MSVIPISLAASLTGASIGAIFGLVRAVRGKQGGDGRSSTSRPHSRRITKESEASAGTSTLSHWDWDLDALPPGSPLGNSHGFQGRTGDRDRTAVWLQQVFVDSQEKDDVSEEQAEQVRPGTLCILASKSGSILRVHSSGSSGPRASHLYTEKRSVTGEFKVSLPPCAGASFHMVAAWHV